MIRIAQFYCHLCCKGKGIALKGYSARHLTAKLRTEIGMSAASSWVHGSFHLCSETQYIPEDLPRCLFVNILKVYYMLVNFDLKVIWLKLLSVTPKNYRWLYLHYTRSTFIVHNYIYATSFFQIIFRYKFKNKLNHIC